MGSWHVLLTKTIVPALPDVQLWTDTGVPHIVKFLGGAAPVTLDSQRVILARRFQQAIQWYVNGIVIEDATDFSCWLLPTRNPRGGAFLDAISWDVVERMVRSYNPDVRGTFQAGCMARSTVSVGGQPTAQIGTILEEGSVPATWKVSVLRGSANFGLDKPVYAAATNDRVEVWDEANMVKLQVAARYAEVLGCLTVVVAIVGGMMRAARLALSIFGQPPSPQDISQVFFALRDYVPRPTYHPAAITSFPRNNLEIPEILGDALADVIVTFANYLQADQPVKRRLRSATALTNKTFEAALAEQGMISLIYPFAVGSLAPLRVSDRLTVIHPWKRSADSLEALFTLRATNDNSDAFDFGLRRARVLGLDVPNRSWAQLRTEGYDVQDAVRGMTLNSIPSRALLHSFNSTFGVSLPGPLWIAVIFGTGTVARRNEMVHLGYVLLKWRIKETLAGSPELFSPRGITSLYKFYSQPRALADMAVPLLQFATANNLWTSRQLPKNMAAVLRSARSAPSTGSHYWLQLDEATCRPAAMVLKVFFALLAFSGNGLSSTSVVAAFNSMCSPTISDVATTLQTRLGETEFSGRTPVVCASLGKFCQCVIVQTSFAGEYHARVLLHGNEVATATHVREPVAQSQAVTMATAYFASPANQGRIRSLCTCPPSTVGEEPPILQVRSQPAMRSPLMSSPSSGNAVASSSAQPTSLKRPASSGPSNGQTKRQKTS